MALRTPSVRFAMFCVLVAFSASAFASITVSSPTNGSSSGSPVHFVANATSSHPISYMRMYIDGKSVFAAATSKIDSSIAVAVGTHTIDIQVWDTAGVLQRSLSSVKVSGTTAPPPSPTPTTTGGYGNVDSMSGWGSCAACAGIGANGPNASLTTALSGSPSLDGTARKFTIASGSAYADGLWWKSLPGNDSKSHFTFDYYFYVTNPAASEALEFDVNQSAANRRYIYGTQCGVNYDHQWDVWDTAANTWRPTGIACSPLVNSWNHVTWEFERSGGRIHFIAVTMNGKKSFVNRWYNSKAWGASEISIAVQLDQRANHVTYSTWVDKINLTMW
jgi:hypothetical protein